MGQRAQVAHRLHGIDQLREAAFDDGAVHVLDARGRTGHARDRMQHDEAGPAGFEARIRGRFAAEFQTTVRMGVDVGDVAERVCAILHVRRVADREALRGFMDAQIAEIRRQGAPGSASHQETDAADDLGVAETDRAQVACVQQG